MLMIALVQFYAKILMKQAERVHIKYHFDVLGYNKTTLQV